VYSNLVPLVALLGGLVVLDESITWPQMVGGGLIIGGLFVMRWEQRRKQQALEQVARYGAATLPRDD